MRGLLQHWTKSSIIPISKEESVWRNKRPRSRTVSFAEDKSRCFINSTLSSRIESMEFIDRGAAPFIHSGEKWKGKNKINIRDASLDFQPKIQSSSVEETLQRIMGQTNNDCRFRIFISTNSLHQPRLIGGRWGSRPRYVLVHNSLRKLCNGSKKWRWLIQWMIWNLRVL